MKPAPIRRPAVSLTGASLTLLVALTVAPATARAGCSHYVLSKLHESASSSLNDLQVLAELPGATREAGQAPSRRSDSPCSSPLCSGRPSRPEAPDVVVTPSRDRWCDTTEPVSLSDSGPEGVVVEGPSPRPVGRPSAVERPPRTPSPALSLSVLPSH